MTEIVDRSVAVRLLSGVMGGAASVQVVGGDDPAWLLDVATARLADLEDRWSRFRPGSDVSRASTGAGTWVDLHPDTTALLQLALDAWRTTEGLVDPTVAAALVAAGYDRTFADVGSPPPPSAPSAAPTPGAPTPAGIRIDAAHDRVALPVGVTIDLGGIGKGRAADLVAAELVALGAAGACVDLGGDVAVRGTGPHDGAWVVSVADPWHAEVPEHDLGLLRLAEGGVATSTTLLRRWRTADGRTAHHLIDPTTGRPSTTTVVAVTVLAAEAAWAEVLAKAALLAGPGRGVEVLEEQGVAGWLVDRDGATTTTTTWDRFASGAWNPPSVVAA